MEKLFFTTNDHVSHRYALEAEYPDGFPTPEAYVPTHVFPTLLGEADRIGFIFSYYVGNCVRQFIADPTVTSIKCFFHQEHHQYESEVGRRKQYSKVKRL